MWQFFFFSLLTGFLLLVGLQTVTVSIFAVKMGTVFLHPGGVMGPKTVWMTLMKLAAVSGEGPG